MPIQAVLSQHADEAAFLWTSRARAVGDPTYSLRSLARLDDRVEAHLDGLRIAGEAAWRLCQSRLESGEASEVFPLAVLAFEAGDRERMRDVLIVGCVSAETRRALVSALDESTLRTQVLLTTHSPDLLEAEEVKHGNVRVVRMIDGKTVIGPVDAADIEIVEREFNTLAGLEREDRLDPDLDDLDRQQRLALVKRGAAG